MSDDSLPTHLSIIMDGNHRWAVKNDYHASYGHRSGVKTLKLLIKDIVALKIPYLSLFAFSTENWSRPDKEVQLLFRLLRYVFKYNLDELHKNNIKIKIIGNTLELSEELQEIIKLAEDKTSKNSGLTLIIGVNFGGKWDIYQAVKKSTRLENLTMEKFESQLSLTGIPDPDLCIRTGGEFRISNFFLWHFAYTEFYFTNTYWPDFRYAELMKALEDYKKRLRRYGKRTFE